jgi:hypothetical protein
LKEPNYSDFDIRDCNEALQIISGMGVTSVADYQDANLSMDANKTYTYEIAEGSYSYWYKIVAQSDFELNFSLVPKMDSTIQFAIYQVDPNKNFCESYLEDKYRPQRLVLYSDNAATKGVGLTGEANVDYNDEENKDNIIRHTPYHKSLFIEGGDMYFLHVFKINKNEVDHKLTIGDFKIDMSTTKPERSIAENTQKLRAFLTGAPLEDTNSTNTDTDGNVPLVSIVSEDSTESNTNITVNTKEPAKAYADAVFFEYEEEEYEDITIDDLNLPEKKVVDVAKAKEQAERELNQMIADGKEEAVEINEPEAVLETNIVANSNPLRANNQVDQNSNELEETKPVENKPVENKTVENKTVENKSNENSEQTKGTSKSSNSNANEESGVFTVPSVSEDIKSLESFKSSAPIYGQIRYDDGTSPSNSKLVAVDLQGNSRPEYVLTNSSGIFEMYDVAAFKKVVFGFSEYDSHIDVSKDPHIYGVVKDKTKIYGARMGDDEKNFEVRNIPFMDFGDRALTDAFGELSKVDFSDPEAYADALSKFGNQAIEGVEFKIQIGAFKNTKKFERTLPRYENLGKIEKYEMGDGLTRFTLGRMELLSQAESLKKEVRAAGLSDAFIVSFKDGKRSLELR